ncbi:MAG: sigma-70 family RNA polymerase sigma factor [Vicinamibacterales bacterium]
MSESRVDAIERLDVLAAADGAFAMDECAFTAFYERTARPLRAYLVRVSGDRGVADDLLHEAYYRLLRAQVTFDSDDHRRHYLFRIAANLVKDGYRRGVTRSEVAMAADDALLDTSSERHADRAVEHVDLHRALARLSPRERSLLWMAYVDGQSHEELAASHGVKRTSLKTLLHRARRRLQLLLSGHGGDLR